MHYVRRPPNEQVIYRGIKIAPMSGKRSATANAIRDAPRTKSEITIISSGYHPRCALGRRGASRRAARRA